MPVPSGVAFASSAAGGPFRGGPLWGRARRLEAVTAIDVDVGDAHVAAFLGPGTGVPLPWCPRSVLLGRITGVDVRVDIGLCIGRHHPDGSSQNAHTCDSDQ